MKLGAAARVRIALARPLVRVGLGNRALRRWLARRRRDDVRGRGLDEHTAAVLGLDDVDGGSRIWRQTPAVARARLLESLAIVDEAPHAAVAVRDLALPGPAGPIAARLYEAPGLERPAPGLVYLHGGGHTLGDLDSHDALCRRLAVEGRLRVVSVDMRLAPEHPFPAPLDDSLAAFRAVAARTGELGIDPARLGIGGDSAGGNLAAVVALETRRDPTPPALQLLLYPVVDFTFSHPSHTALANGYYLTRRAIDWYAGHYLGGRDELRTDPRVSPLVAPDLAGAAPAYVVVAGFDPLRDEAVAYADRLAAAGVRVELVVEANLIHGFALMTAAVPAARAATSRFIRRGAELLRA
ncbi:MAG: alpha/beta hydrolase [bacterium]